MENIRNTAEAERHLDFDQIVEAARKRRDSERAEYEKASLEHFEAKKLADGKDVRYAIGTFYNEVRTQHFRDTAKTLSVLGDKYGGERRSSGERNSNGILAEYQEQYDALMKQEDKKESDKERAEYLEACIKHMQNILAAEKAVSGYISGSADSPAERFSAARSALDSCLESFEDIMVCTMSDEEFKAGDRLDIQSSYAKIADMSSYMDTLQSGLLVRPNSANSINNGKQTIDGKTIHYVDATHSQPAHELPDAIIQEFNKNNYSPNKLSVDRSDEPLFSHLPNTDDIHQGYLGNCYMLASLSAILRQNPELIMQSMRENPPEESPGYDPDKPETHKKTVTVRFFNESNEPVYVTVDKTVPVLEDPNSGATRDTYSRGSLWVQIFEKAYAASGLHKGLLSEAEAGTLKPSYQDIGSGKTFEFVPQMLGAGENGATGLTETLKKTEEFSFRVPGTRYDRDQIERFEKLEKACEANMIATCRTYGEDEFNEKFSPDEIAEEKKRGIVKGHGYTIVGTEREPQTGKMYVLLRNPHKGKGTTMDNAAPDSNAKGYIKLEFRAFDYRFSEIYLHDFSVSAKKKDLMPEIRDLRRMYGSTLKELDASLRSTDSRMLRIFGNSSSFTRFRKAAKAAVTAVSAKNASPELIKKSMDDLFAAARNYDKHCEGKKLTDKSSFRDLERMKMAKVTMELEKEYSNGKHNETSIAWLGDRTGIATSGYEQTKLLRAQTKAFVSCLDGETPEKRQSFYTQIKKFVDNNEYLKLNVKQLASMNKEEKFEYFRKPENIRRYSCLVMLSEHSDRLLRNMISDGFISSGSPEEKELRFKSAAFDGVRKSLEFVLDSSRYSADMFAAGKGRQELDTLAREGQKAVDDLSRFEQIKQAEGFRAAVNRFDISAPVNRLMDQRHDPAHGPEM